MAEFESVRPLLSGERIADSHGAATPTFAYLWQQSFKNADWLNINKQDADADLDAIAALATTGYAIRTGDGTWATRAITVTVGHLTISNGNGVAGATLLGLPNSGVTAGSYTNADITVDAQGRVTAAANGSAGTSYTDADAQDAVGAILTDSATIDFAYVSATSIAADVKPGSIGPTELASTAVTPGSYTAANITVDADGRITAAANGSAAAGYFIPLVDGSEPPNFITDGAGNLILVAGP